MKRFLVKIKNLLFCGVFGLKMFFLRNKKNDVILCFDCLYDINQESIDAFSLFLELQKNKIPSKYIALENCASCEKIKNYSDVVYVKNRWDLVFRYSSLIASARAILTSYGLLCGIDKVIKNISKNYIFIEHGVTFHQEFIDSLYSCKNFNKILVPTKYTYDLYKKNNSWSDDQMILSGLPRWDRLLASKSNKSIFVFFTWRKAFLDKKTDIANYFSSISSFLGLLSDVIPENVEIAIAWHHEVYKKTEHLPKLNPRIKFVKPNEISCCIQNSDLLITDYSSIFWDYFYQNKPVVFYNPISCNFNETDVKIENEFLEFSKNIYNVFEDKMSAIDKILFYINNDFNLEKEFVLLNDSLFWSKTNNSKMLIDNIIKK